MATKKTPHAPADIAPIELTCTSATVVAKAGKPAVRAKRTIHPRRPAPAIPKGEPVFDETPSAPVKIEKPTVRASRKR
jgi:hypothetical protein